MKKDKEKAKYISPQTRKIVVKLESSICAGSVDVQNKGLGSIEEHKVNTDFDFTFNDQEWEIGQTEFNN